MSINKDKDREFYNKLNPQLAQFYQSAQEDSCDKQYLYPLQYQLSQNTPRFGESTVVDTGAVKIISSALDKASGRRIAIARMQDDCDAERIENFLREARLTASLQHPNIIRIYNIGIDNGPWFSMELIEGQSLQEKIDHVKSADESSWPLFQRLEIFNKICDAVAYAHSKKVLHLDIKPANIRLGTYGEVILCDWGLGHTLNSGLNSGEIDLKNNQTLHGFIKGTPGYMAPEQINGQKGEAADIFALGGLLFSLMTLDMPFNGENLDEVLTNTQCTTLNESAKLSLIPSGLLPVIHKALSADPVNRYKNTVKLQKEVEKYRAGFATDAEHATLFTQSLLLYSRNRLVCNLSLLFALIFISSTILYIHSINRVQSDLVMQRDRLQKEEKRVQEALLLYKNEHEENEQIAKNLAHLQVLKARDRTNKFKTSNALAILDRAIKRSPNKDELWIQKGYTHFIRREFARANKCFATKQYSIIADLEELSREYAMKGPLSAAQLVELFKKFTSPRLQLRLYMMMYDAQTTASLQDHSVIIRHLLRVRNDLAQLNFIYDAKEKSLDLSNNPELKLVSFVELKYIKKICLLDTLQLSKLTLRGTAVSSVEQFTNLKLTEINLSGTAVRDLRPLLKMKSLTHLILNSAQESLTKGINWPFEITFEE